MIGGVIRTDSRLAPSQWETLLQSNAVSHWLGTNLESALDDVTFASKHFTVKMSNNEVYFKIIHFTLLPPIPELLSSHISVLPVYHHWSYPAGRWLISNWIKPDQWSDQTQEPTQECQSYLSKFHIQLINPSRAEFIFLEPWKYSCVFHHFSLNGAGHTL